MNSWNPVFNLVMKIKYEYIDKFNDNSINLEEWIEKLNNKNYIDIFECLQINQNKNLILIRYGLSDMQESMWSEKDSIYRECRSIVIDLKNDRMVLTPFRKFFNLNEVEENKLDNVLELIKKAKRVEIVDKLDGSMQSARYYMGEIFMSGSMAIDKENSWRLEEGYSMLTDNHKKMIIENPDKTFIFEYISVKDAHVVLYSKEQEGLYLIGIRDVKDGFMVSYQGIKNVSELYNVPMANIENKTLQDILIEMKEHKSYQKEGWIINIDGHMIKIKCDDYVHLHKLLDKFSSVNVIIENIAEDRIDDMISKVPENYRDRILSVANRIIKYRDDTIKNIKSTYEKAPREDRKQFMVWVDNNCDKTIKGYVRNLYLGKSYNVLKINNNGYKKLKDLGIVDSYSALFSNLEDI